MNIVFVLALGAYLHDLSASAWSNENVNVLVPDNDVNLHDKVKKLFTAEAEPEDFTENEIARLDDLKISKIRKFRKKSVESANVVNDNEDNQIDRDVSISRESDESLAFGFTPPDSETFDDGSDESAISQDKSDEWTSTYEHENTSKQTETRGTSTTPEERTSNATTYLTPLTVSVDSSTTSASISTTVHQTSTSTPTSSSSSAPESTTADPDYDDLQSDECLSGKSDGIRTWIDDGGHLNDTVISVIFGAKSLDLTKLINDYEIFKRNIKNNKIFEVRRQTISSQTSDAFFLSNCQYLGKSSIEWFLFARPALIDV
jgi:hypothetical protein